MENRENPPPETSYVELHKCCCCRRYYFPDIETTFWEHWEASPWMPLFVISFSTLVIVVYIVMSSIHHAVVSLYLLIFDLPLLGMFIFSFFQVIIIGPGYYGYDWPWNGLSDPGPEGVLTKSEQYEIIQRLPRPPRSNFFRSARRYVARPDHFCDWVSSWIGKRNMKAFILMTSYGFLSCLSIVISSIPIFVVLINKELIWTSILLGALMIVVCVFALLTLSFTVELFAGACKGVTTWEHNNNINIQDFVRDRKWNLSEVFGDTSCIYWFFPTDPWKGIPTNELMEGLPTYKHLYQWNNVYQDTTEFI